MSEVLNGFEALEDRVLLAGNVTVSLNGAGDLVITGDGSGNYVDIVDTDGDGYYEIQDGDGFTNIIDAGGILDGINELTVLPPSGKVIINLNGGNDNLYIEESYGSGGDLGLGLSVAIDMGAGNDYVEVNSFFGDIYFDTATVNLGTGNDFFYWYGDYDYVNNLTVNGGTGIDDLIVDYLYVDNLALNGGAGNDYIETYEVYNYYGAGTLSINGGKGTDIVYMQYTYSDHTNIVMDGATDIVDIYDSEFYYDFTLKGGAKADYVTIYDSYFYGINTLKGGGGKDYLDILGNGNFFSAATTIKSWKYIV